MELFTVPLVSKATHGKRMLVLIVTVLGEDRSGVFKWKSVTKNLQTTRANREAMAIATMNKLV